MGAKCKKKKKKKKNEKVGLNLNVQNIRLWNLVHQFKAYSWGNNGNSDRLYFSGLQNHC